MSWIWTRVETALPRVSVGRFDYLVIAASLGAFTCYFLSALIHGELTQLMFVMPQYLFMLPTYANIFSVFSFCNMHDISWGTKEGTYCCGRTEDGGHVQQSHSRGTGAPGLA